MKRKNKTIAISIFIFFTVLAFTSFYTVRKNKSQEVISQVELQENMDNQTTDDEIITIGPIDDNNEVIVNDATPVNETTEVQETTEQAEPVTQEKETEAQPTPKPPKPKPQTQPEPRPQEQKDTKTTTKADYTEEPIEVVDSLEVETVTAPSEDTTETTEALFVIDSISEDVKKRIVDVSWKSECPVPLEYLSYVKISYLDFNNETQVGELIVHKKIAQEIVDIFKELYEGGFQIAKMTLVDNYDADDTKSMEDNNTSAFNYRPVAGTTKLSKHSYGIAIDINPIQNPYVKGDYVSPKAGASYLDRSIAQKGMIVKNDICYKAFKNRGWIWGGEWNTMKDYQHFQKKIDLELLVK